MEDMAESLTRCVERISMEQAASFDAAARLLVELGVTIDRMERASFTGSPSTFTETRLRVDGKDVWRHWWEKTGEYQWSAHSEWLRHPGTLIA